MDRKKKEKREGKRQDYGGFEMVNSIDRAWRLKKRKNEC